MSGAGKSSVLDALEDMGWDCVDNLPVSLLESFVRGDGSECRLVPAAVGMDVRSRGFDAAALPDVLRRVPGVRPEILYLDEPTIGLDVVAKARVREFLAEINRERGVTIMLTTHDLGDIERLCDRLLVIDRGALIYDGTLARLKERYGDERTLVVDLEEERAPLEVPGATVVRVDGPRQWLRFRREQTTAAQLAAAVGAQATLIDLSVEEPDIESIVREIYRR